jgi:hypothetical protein
MFQFIVSSDGVVGLCYEHSPAEGIGILNLIDEFLQELKSGTRSGASVKGAVADLTDDVPDHAMANGLKDGEELVLERVEISKPIRLEWVLSPESRNAIIEAGLAIDG